MGVDFGGVLDASTIEGRRDFKAIPNGPYPLAITDSELKPNSKRTGAYIELEILVLDGPHKGAKLWDVINVQNPNPETVKIAYQTLGEIGRATGVMQARNCSEYHNIPMIGEVVAESEKRNKITKYLPMPAGYVPGAVAPANAFGAPAAAAPVFAAPVAAPAFGAPAAPAFGAPAAAPVFGAPAAPVAAAAPGFEGRPAWAANE